MVSIDNRLKALEHRLNGVRCDFVIITIGNDRRELPWNEALPLIAGGEIQEIEFNPAHVQNGEFINLLKALIE